MIHLDTSALIDALTGPRRSLGHLREAIDRGERLGVSTIVLYEWWRGPRQDVDLRIQESICPSDQAAAFGRAEAALAAKLYATVRRPRGRELDLAIAACAITQQASLWTLNPQDFDDIPQLRLHQP
jgi:predicted nucleic acid-binding protein